MKNIEKNLQQNSMQGDTRAETGLAYYQHSVFFIKFNSDNNKFSGLMLTLLRTTFALEHHIEDIFYCLLESKRINSLQA